MPPLIAGHRRGRLGAVIGEFRGKAAGNRRKQSLLSKARIADYGDAIEVRQAFACPLVFSGAYSCSAERIIEPCQTCVGQGRVRYDGADLKPSQRQRRISTDHTKLCGMPLGELSGKCSDKIRAGNDSKRKHEIRHGERDPARVTAARQHFVDEAIRIAGQRDDKVLHLAI